MNEKKSNRRHSGRPTVNDVARLAQCSPMTVSRVVNGGSGVKPDTRLAVEAAIKELDYAPNKAARSLAGASQIRLALLYTNPSAAYLSELLIGCMDAAARTDAHLVVERCEEGMDDEKVINRLMAGGIDGFLLPPPLCEQGPLLDLLRAKRAQAVLISPGRADAHHGAVMIDDYQAAYDMTLHLIAQGHQNIAFVKGTATLSATALRYAGFRDAMAKEALPIDPTLVVDGLFTYRSGLDAGTELLKRADRPTAIFASNDDMAAGCIAAAHRKRLDVPGDLTVVGFDDTDIASTIWPELTTIRQPIRDMAQAGLDLLVSAITTARISKTNKAKHLTLDYTLVQRESDQPPA
jgi:LacI family transcriptional regulator